MSQLENPSPEEIKGILEKSGVIAVVGLSPKPERVSNEVASYLQSKGYKVLTALSGEEALEFLNNDRNKFDLIVTDYVMRKMTHIVDGGVVTDIAGNDAGVCDTNGDGEVVVGETDI